MSIGAFIPKVPSSGKKPGPIKPVPVAPPECLNPNRLSIYVLIAFSVGT